MRLLLLLLPAPAVSYHFVPGVALKDFAMKDAKGGQELISTNDKEPTILKTGEGWSSRDQPAVFWKVLPSQPLGYF